MLEPDFVQYFITPLNRTGITYMITGSIASIIYGEPRLTHDIDVVVSISFDDVQKIIAAFPIENYYCPPEEVIRVESQRSHRGHFNIIHNQTGLKADFFILSKDIFQQETIKRRIQENYFGEKLWIAPIEYVILWKLLFYKEGESIKHINDVRNILVVSKDKIDNRLLRDYIDRYSLSKEWSLCMDKSITH